MTCVGISIGDSVEGVEVSEEVVRVMLTRSCRNSRKESGRDWSKGELMGVRSSSKLSEVYGGVSGRLL